MSTLTIILIALVIYGLTSFLSLLGKGGGEFFVPIMLAFSVPFQQAATSSLFILIFSGASMTYIYHKQRMINWMLALLLILITSVMAFLGGFFSHMIPEMYLKLAFSILLFISSILIAKQIHRKKSLYGSKGGFAKKLSRLFWKNEFQGEEYHINVLVFPIIALIAFLAGSVGISGGGIIVPLLIIVGGLPLRIAFATNAVLVFTSSLAGFLGHGLAGEFNPRLAIPLGIAGFLGGQTGSRFAKRVDVRHLRAIFVLILLVAAIWMFFRAIYV